MKKIMLSLLVCIACSNTFAQIQANPAIELSIASTSIDVNQTTNLYVIAQNTFGDTQIVANSLRIIVSVGTNAEIIGIGTATTGKWTFLSNTTGTANTYRFTNTSTIEKDAKDTIFLQIKGVAYGGPSNIDGMIGYINANNPLLLNNANNASQGDSDPSSGSNNSTTSLTVQKGILAVTFAEITAAAVDCAAKITWSTLSEDAGTSFDVEYSPDGGSRFVKVGSVAGRSSLGSHYSYTYNQANGKGFYRLKIASITGAAAYSKVVNVLTICIAKKVFIYPNPVQNLQNINVNVTNFVGAVKGDLINAMGQIVLTQSLINGSNTVKIVNVPQGTYTFKVTDETKEIQNFKIVVVK